MHNGSSTSTRKYRVPRSLLYSSAILSLTQRQYMLPVPLMSRQPNNLFKQQQLEEPKACSIS